MDVVKRATKREEYRQEDEAVCHSVNDYSNPHFEEVLENVAVAGSKNDDGEEGGKRAMEHTWTHLANCSSGFEDSLFPF